MHLIDFEFRCVGTMILASPWKGQPHDLHSFHLDLYNSMYDQDDYVPDELRRKARAIEVCEMLNKAANYARETQTVEYAT